MTEARELGSLTLPSELANLETFQAQLAAWAEQAGLEPKRIGMLTMALEELFVNICDYAYPDGPGPVWMNGRQEGVSFVVELIDEGPAFDPDSLAEPDLEAELEARSIGGLGWFLVRKIADRLESFRQDGRNIVRLTLHGRS